MSALNLVSEKQNKFETTVSVRKDLKDRKILHFYTE